MIPNALICDHELSPAAHRVAMYLYSRPDNWRVNNTDIKNNTGYQDPETIAKALKELIAKGWITRKRTRAEAGKLSGTYDYELNQEPVLPVNGKEPYTEKTRKRETPVYGQNPVHSNTEKGFNNTKSLINNTEFSAQAQEDNFSEAEISDIAFEIFEPQPLNAKKEKPKSIKQSDVITLDKLEIPQGLSDVRFLNLYEKFMREPKQRKKSIGAHNLTLQKLERFDIEFAIELVEAAMCSNYQGVVFPDTAAKYAEWQKKRKGAQANETLMERAMRAGRETVGYKGINFDDLDFTNNG